MTRPLSPLADRLAGREKTPRLREDLHSLGMTRGQIDALPLCDTLPNVATISRALGSRYVLEGATLGGQVVSRHLESTLGLREGAGYSFYRGYGPARVAEMWRAFGTVLLDTSAADPASDDLIVAGAVDTFDCLSHWLAAD
jgi:heme oxygenase